jgi:hypothetical protein
MEDSELKVGMRVKVVKPWNTGNRYALGDEGTVDHVGTGLIHVKFDGDVGTHVLHPSEFERAPQTTATRTGYMLAAKDPKTGDLTYIVDTFSNTAAKSWQSAHRDKRHGTLHEMRGAGYRARRVNVTVSLAE